MHFTTSPVRGGQRGASFRRLSAHRCYRICRGSSARSCRGGLDWRSPFARWLGLYKHACARAKSWLRALLGREKSSSRNLRIPVGVDRLGSARFIESNARQGL